MIVEERAIRRNRRDVDIVNIETLGFDTIAKLCEAIFPICFCSLSKSSRSCYRYQIWYLHECIKVIPTPRNRELKRGKRVRDKRERHKEERESPVECQPLTMPSLDMRQRVGREQRADSAYTCNDVSHSSLFLTLTILYEN